MIRSRPELEQEVYKTLMVMWEFPLILQTIGECNGDIEAAITKVYQKYSGFCIYGGAFGRGNFDHEVSLLKSGYFKLWEPENGEIMTRKPDLVLSIKEIFNLIKNGPSQQLSLL